MAKRFTVDWQEIIDRYFPTEATQRTFTLYTHLYTPVRDVLILTYCAYHRRSQDIVWGALFANKVDDLF